MNDQRLRELMRAHRVDALVATSPENIFYASGHKPFQGVWNRFPKALILFADEPRPTLMLPISEAGFLVDSGADQRCDVQLIGVSNLVIGPHEDAYDESEARIAAWTKSASRSFVEAVLAACRAHLAPNAAIAVDRTGAPELFDALQAAGEGFVWRDRGEDLWRVARMVKTDAEVGRLTAAARLNEAAIDAMHAVLGTETDAGAERVFRTAVASGGGNVQHFVGNAGRLAGIYRSPKQARPKAGERFRFDVGIELDGYCSDLGGTAQVAIAPSAEERRVYAALKAGIDCALDTARPGLRTSDLYDRVIGAVRKAGLPDYRFSLAGHGIGVEPRDFPIVAPPLRTSSPFLEASFDPLLEAGMVINIECPLNVLAEGAYQHEITLLIETDGARPMSARRDYLIGGIRT